MHTTQKFWFVLAGAILGMALIACSCGSIVPMLTRTATPIEAPEPTFIPPAGLVPSYDRLPYKDDFSDPGSGWDVYSTDNGSAGYGSGTYFVISKTKDISSYGTPGKFFGDTSIDVDATAVSGPADSNFSASVGCRTQANDDGYEFEIGADGYYSVGYYTGRGSDFTSLLSGDEWQSSKAIQQGMATNHMTVTCAGTNLKLAVNGQVLYTGQDSTFTDGDISLGAATYSDDTTPAEIHFDNLAVKQP